MFLITKFRIYLLFIVAMIAFIVIGINGYIIFSHINSGDSMSIKYFAENFIFYILIILILLTIVFVSMLMKSNNIYRELEKVIELSRQGRYSGGSQLKSLGTLGQKIIEINAHLNSLSEMKSLKISSLSNIVNFLLEKSDLAVFVLDAQGMIIKVSNHLLGLLEIDEKNIVNRYAENVLDQFNFSNVIIELRKSKYVTMRSSFNVESFEKPMDLYLVIYPIFNYRNEISNCICRIVSEEEFENLSSIKIDKSVQAGKVVKSVPEGISELPMFTRFIKDVFHKNT